MATTIDYDALARDFVNTSRAPAAAPGEASMFLPRAGFPGLTPPNVPIQGAVAPAVSGAPAGAVGRMAAQLPTAGKMVRGADGVLRMVGRFGATAGRAVGPFVGPAAGALAFGGEALGVADTAADPNTTKIDVATRAAEGVGRLGAMAAGGGLGAVAGGPIGAAIGGTLGYLAPNVVYSARDWFMNRGAPAPAAPAPAATAPAAPAVTISGAPTVQDLPLDPAGFGATPRAPEPFTRADIEGGRVPVSGAGGALNPRTGEVINFDTRGGEPAVVPTGRTANGLPDIGGFFGATAHLRNIAQDNAQKAAAARYKMQYGGTFEKNTAAAANENLRTAAAQEHLRTHPGDYPGAAAIASGRVQPHDAFSVPFPPMTDKEPVTVLNRSTGALEKRQPTQYATEANIQASMAAKKLTRAQTLDAYKKQGFDVSRIAQ